MHWRRMSWLLAAGIATALAGCVLVALDAIAPHGGRRMLLAAAALAIVAPGMAVGYSVLLAQLELGGPQDLWWWAGFLLLRCAPWCLPLIAFSGGASDRAAVALGLPPLRRAVAVLREHGPMLALASGMAGGAAALREFEYFAAFGLPAGESLAARSAQMLHFGLRPPLAALMLVQLAIALGWSAVVLLLWRRRA
jgi:hypothetical protein